MTKSQINGGGYFVARFSDLVLGTMIDYLLKCSVVVCRDLNCKQANSFNSAAVCCLSYTLCVILA